MNFKKEGIVMLDKLYEDAKKKMDHSIESFLGELKKVRTGRAQVSMLDTVRVSYYGNLSPLSQVAKVSCPDGKSFLIAPWEPQLLKEIEQAIIKSELGMTPINDGKVIRLRLPDLTEERRKELAKLIKKMAEDARIAIRLVRRTANEEVKKGQKEKELSEDSSRNLLDKIQKVTDDYIKKIDQIATDKEKDVLTI